MNFQTFKMMAAKWASEKIIPALAPEGPLRWVFAFAGMNKVMDTLEDAITRARTVAAPLNQQRFG
jgi:hypothetical protein